MSNITEHKPDEYYTHSGDRIKIRHCDCGHNHLDHDEWGGGECLKCDCTIFQEDRVAWIDDTLDYINQIKRDRREVIND